MRPTHDASSRSCDRLAQGDAAPAREMQRHAAEFAERGAQHAEDLAAVLRAEKAAADGLEAQADVNANAKANADAKHVPPGSPHALSQAREAMAKAGEQLGQGQSSGMQAARKAMQSATDQLRAAASAPPPGRTPRRASAPRRVAQADSASSTPQSGRAGIAVAVESRELKELIQAKTGRAWGELPGHLRTEILQMSQGRYRDDYVRLIELYFREIAEGEKRK